MICVTEKDLENLHWSAPYQIGTSPLKVTKIIKFFPCMYHNVHVPFRVCVCMFWRQLSCTSSRKYQEVATYYHEQASHEVSKP